jgi:hypothetical protein
MTSGCHHSAQGLHSSQALAFSESMTRARLLNSEHLFSKHKEGHVVELTRFVSDAVSTSLSHRFISCEQLSTYFDSDVHSAPRGKASMDI